MQVSARAKYLGLGVTIALVAIVAASLLFWGDYETEQSGTRTFVIAEDFTTVRKILVRKNGAQQIVTMGGDSEFISQDIQTVGGELKSPRVLYPDFRLETHGTLRVRTKDEYVGRHEIDLAQHAVIEVDFLHSEVELDEPVGRLRDYRMTTHFERIADGQPGAGGTRVELKLTQRILTSAPWFAHGIADRRVRESVDRTLANQEAAIQRFIAENLDDVPLLPLR